MRKFIGRFRSCKYAVLAPLGLLRFRSAYRLGSYTCSLSHIAGFRWDPSQAS